MEGLYGGKDDGEDFDEDDMEKPTWDNDIDIDDLGIDLGLDSNQLSVASSSKVEKKKKKKKKRDESEDEGGVDVDAMDANVEERRGEEEEWDGTEEMRKRKLDEYMDEVYKLDFNDLVGDIPTRFHYTPVAPSSFALTPVEILLATDKELNEYVSVKKYAPYRKSGGIWDKGRNERLTEFKQKLGVRRWGRGNDGDIEEQEEGEKKKKRKGKKERSKMKAAVAAGEEEGMQENSKRKRPDEDQEAESTEEAVNKKRKRRKKKAADLE